MYCKCKQPQLKKVTINKEVIDVCSKSLGGCGEEITNVLKLEECNIKITDGTDYLHTGYNTICWNNIQQSSFYIPFDGIYNIVYENTSNIKIQETIVGKSGDTILRNNIIHVIKIQ